jgi:hypothetical protein
MSCCGLDAESILDRVAASAVPPRVPTARQSLFIGGVGFGLVGVAAFAVWAFAGGVLTRVLGEGGFYAVCAVVFIGLSGLVFGQLIIGPGGVTRMYTLFTPAFLAYATLWCAAWFALAGRKDWMGGELKAEILGAALGAVAMSAVMIWGFGAKREFSRALLALFAGNALGYFLGKVAWQWLRGEGAQVFAGLLTRQQRGWLAMLAWGLLYGLCFGAAIGHVIYLCQEAVRERLRTGIPLRPVQ